jgi:hypothetical protein
MRALATVPAYFVGSLTVDPNRAFVELGKNALRGFADTIARMVGEHIIIVYAFERTQAGQREIPAIIAKRAGTRAVTTKTIEKAWRHGNAWIREFKPNVGGLAYVTKTGDPGIVPGCPGENACLRHSGCKFKGQSLDPRTT